MNDFPAVPLLEHRPYDRIREFYLYQEPALLAAIQRRDRGESIHIVNHILVHIYSAGQERSDLLKGLLLELVVMISRAVVEAGAPQSEVLGLNYHCITELSEIDDDEQLAQWLRATLERMFDALEQQRDFTPPLLVTKALRYIRDNMHRDVTRDQTARHAGISPSHFSRLLKLRTGRSFTELLRQCRIDLASKLLQDTERSLAEIADACGFCDQSHFTHVFQQTKQMTPRQFRTANCNGQTALPRSAAYPKSEASQPVTRGFARDNAETEALRGIMDQMDSMDGRKNPRNPAPGRSRHSA